MGLLTLWLLSGCRVQSWNQPQKNTPAGQTIYYSAFAERPKSLDPARAYSMDEMLFVSQIYEPPLQYHYLKHPYVLTPLTATALPSITYFNAQHQHLPAAAPAALIAESVLDIHLRNDISYADHPAFARDAKGQLRYAHLSPAEILRYKRLQDFAYNDHRTATAADYIYQIKRLANPRVNSPIYSVMAEHIIGLRAFAKTLADYLKAHPQTTFLDLRRFKLSGVRQLGPYHFQIRLAGKYPQMRYWLAMPFFAPIPWEVDAFYAQPGMATHNLSWDWYPAGTGAYQLTENNPNRQMVLTRNPHFHLEVYPSDGSSTARAHGLLADAGRRLPMIDTFLFALEKESIPRWHKFLQGYYDKSAIGNDQFDQAVALNAAGEPDLTAELKAKHIRLQTQVEPAVQYLGFNMLDPIVGSANPRAKYLRQAISIALDYEEFIAIFANGRGQAAQGPLPPGIFGSRTGRAGINPVVYRWHQGHAERRPLADAKRLMAKAGYPGGRTQKTGQPLVLYYDTTSASGPDDKARFDWLRKQFAKLGIELQIRATQYNRFRQKVRTGDVQLFSWGWYADYPDPENFLFLFYGPNGKVKHQGENASNYNNSTANRLFEALRHADNGPTRQALIDQMISQLRQDCPWVFGYYPKTFQLSHAWNGPSHLHTMARNTLKYLRLDTAARACAQHAWNTPRTGALWGLLVGFLGLIAPAYWVHRRRQKRSLLDP